MSTCSSLYLFSFFFFHFWHNLHVHNNLWTHLLGHLPTDSPENYLSVYPHASVSSNHKDLPVTTTASLPAPRCIRSWPYVFVFILSFRLTAEIYPSTFLLNYMYADAPGYQDSYSVYFFRFGITCTITVPLICWGMYTQIHPKINIPVYLHASPLPKNKTLPVTTTTCIPALKCTRSWQYLFSFILLFYLINL